MESDDWRLDPVLNSKPGYLPAFGSDEWKPTATIESYNPRNQVRARNWPKARELIASLLEDREIYVDVEIVIRRQVFQPYLLTLRPGDLTVQIHNQIRENPGNH